MLDGIFAIFGPKYALRIPKIQENSPLKNIFFKGHIKNLITTKFRY